MPKADALLPLPLACVLNTSAAFGCNFQATPLLLILGAAYVLTPKQTVFVLSRIYQRSAQAPSQWQRL
jgi:hypothetical protein